ncbi:MAG: hypothetical protein ACRDS9_26960 [Pseudonocardiaceae bacterium]
MKIMVVSIASTMASWAQLDHVHQLDVRCGLFGTSVLLFGGTPMPECGIHR